LGHKRILVAASQGSVLKEYSIKIIDDEGIVIDDKRWNYKRIEVDLIALELSYQP
jgi:hypothetical protein